MKVLQVTLDLLRILQEELEDVAGPGGVCAVHCCNWCNLDPDKFANIQHLRCQLLNLFQSAVCHFQNVSDLLFQVYCLKKGPAFIRD